MIDSYTKKHELTFFAAIFSLMDGDEPYAGRLIVFFMDIWGTVCSDKFNDKAAKVACKSMNLK